jgi:hypothetical protein
MAGATERHRTTSRTKKWRTARITTDGLQAQSRVRDLLLHSLRHFAAYRMVAAGVPVLAEVLARPYGL